jgi:hypothetical protein
MATRPLGEILRGLRATARLALAAVTLACATPAAAVDEDAVAGCHEAILRGQHAVVRGRIAHVARCLKEGNYDGCVETDFHAAVHEQELRNHVAGASSACAAAIASGAPLADFGPTACASEWESCDTEVPAISSLDDLAECLLCQERGYDFLIRDVLGFPRPVPEDIDERRCTRLVANVTQNTIRKSILDLVACADGKAKPFSCAIDATTESRFGAALDKFGKRIGKCGVDEGKAPGALANLCGGTAMDSQGLTDCFTGLAKCIACRRANSALGQGEDCQAFSGFAGCDGVF